MAIAASVVLGAGAKSYKRGVSENGFTLVSQLEALEPGVSWYYNWGNAAGVGFDGVDQYEGIEYVPMCWSGNYNADKIREYCKAHPQTKYLLGFNEPNFKAQANMTPQVAAEAWPAVQALAKELGLKLVAPVLNYSPDAPYTDPLKWMDEFVAIVGLDAFDFTAVHNYGGLGVMKRIAGDFHDKYGKDVWVTEFCYWPNEGNNNSYVAPDIQINSMVETLEWLETTPWIYRYAWFKAVGKYNDSKSPNYGLVKQSDGGAYLDPWELSPQGEVYVNISEFDPDKWHPTGVTIPAIDYIKSNLLGLNCSASSDAPYPVEISKFDTGASVDWQFDIPTAGEYIISLGLTGFGEPSRFDPQIQWVTVDNDKETAVSAILKPTLPNNETDYVTFTSKASLPAGHIQLRLKDMAPYQPSGIRISSLRIDDAAGVEEIGFTAEDANQAIYNLQGVRVGTGYADFNNLPKGLYIVGNKKIVKTN